MIQPKYGHQLDEPSLADLTKTKVFVFLQYILVPARLNDLNRYLLKFGKMYLSQYCNICLKNIMYNITK